MSLSGVRWIPLPNVIDDRGVLTAIEGGKDVPFEIARIFYMHGTPAGVDRGGHAHRDTHQVAISIGGSFKMEVSDGTTTQVFELSDPNQGLYLQPMRWVRLYGFASNAVCLVLADTHYDRARSLRSWEAFLSALAERRETTQ
jgi:hypothetical protein